MFFLKADICQLGIDQRKVNMLAREYAGDKKMRFKPVVVSHHMLSGLKEGQEKMSKSDPDSAIFMEDTVEDVKRKLKKAYCPPGTLPSPCHASCVLRPVSCVLCPVSCVMCPVCSVLCPVSCVLCAVCCVPCAVCRMISC